MPQSTDQKQSPGVGTQKFKTIERTVRTGVECEERAFKIVTKLIENHVDGDYLIDCGRLINQEHYNDIVEERAISDLCGYPVCPNLIGEMPKKKYHVSLKTNRVYEISERKNFCSNWCYKASKYFSHQIPDSPLWMRDKEQAPSIRLLEKDTVKVVTGDEVIGGNPKVALKDELKSLEELDKKTGASKKKSRTGEQPMGVRQHTTKVKTETDVANSTKPIEDETESISLSVPQNLEPEKDFYTPVTLDETGDSDKRTSVDDHLPSLVQNFSNLSTVGDISIENVQVTESSTLNNVVLKTEDVSNSHDDVPHSKKESPTKMDQLKALLAKRKNVLSGMVDIQAFSGKPAAEHQPHQPSSKGRDAPSHLGEGSCSEKKPEASEQLSPEMTSSPSSVSQLTRQVAPQQTLASHPNGAELHPQPSTKQQPVLHVCSILKTWMTGETSEFLSSSGDSQSTMSFSNPKIQQGYGALCQRLAAREREMEAVLNSSEMAGEPDGSTKSARPSKAVPDYKVLKQQTEAFSLKVMEFITGKKQTPKKQEVDEPEEEEAVCLPTVDAYDQHQIRVKIVLERLDKSLPDLLAPLCLSVQDVSGPIREFIHTCRLEKDNIVLRPGEWTLTALLILKMLATRHSLINSAFRGDLAIRHFSAVLGRLDHSLSDLSSLAQDIINVANQLR